jgi:hypothetical protein
MAMIAWARATFFCALVSAFGSSVACDAGSSSACSPASPTPLIQCPGLFTLLVAPDRVAVGGAVAVTATASAPAGTEAGATDLSWTAPSGTFSDPASSLTTFTCTSPGTVTLSLTATRGGCAETLNATVSCLAP